MKEWVRTITVMFVLVFPATAVPGRMEGRTMGGEQQIEAVKTFGAFVPGRLLVGFDPEAPASRVQSLIRALGARESGGIAGIGVRVVELPKGVDEEFYLAAFKTQPEVLFAELDRALPPDNMTPDDPSFPSEWHLPKIASLEAWSTTTGSSSVTIAILDTGIDPTHPDLVSKLVPGWNTYDNNSDTQDVYGHGTAVAGAAAASTNNTLGVASVAWGCQIMPIRISDVSGFAFTSTTATGLTWAADHGASVANISYQFSNSLTVKNAARYFQDRGGVVVISAGNNSAFDANPDNPYVLTVSATTSTDALAGWSNRGNNIDVAAPGVSIITTVRDGGYASWSGTSFSAPIVAGAAALVLSVNPGLTGSEVQDCIKRGAEDLGPAGWDAEYGAGRLNVANSVTLATVAVDTTPPSVSITSPSDGSRVTGANLAVLVDVSDDVRVVNVELYVDGVLKAKSTKSPYTIKLSLKKLAAQSLRLQCKAYDAEGNAGVSQVVTVYR